MMYSEKASDPDNDPNWDRVDEVTVFILGWSWLFSAMMLLLYALTLLDNTF